MKDRQEGRPRCRRRVVGMLVTSAAVMMMMMNGTAVAFVVLPPAVNYNKRIVTPPLGVSSRPLTHGHTGSDSRSRSSPPHPNKPTRRNKKTPHQRHYGHDRKCIRFNQYLQKLVQEQKVEQAVQALQNAMSLSNSAGSSSSSSRVNTNDAAAKNINHEKKDTTTQVLYNVVSFNTVLNGLATVGNAPAAQVLWDQFVPSSSTNNNRSNINNINNNNHRPDIRSYNILIKAYCRYSNHSSSNSNHHGVEQAQQILEEMMSSANDNDSIPSPDTTSYNTVLSTLLRIGRVKEADALLWRQWNHYSSSHPDGDDEDDSLDRNPSITTLPPPTTQMCNQLLHAWTKTTMTTTTHNNGDDGVGMIREDKVNSLWALMQEYGSSHGFGPDIVSYNTMLNAHVHNPPFVQDILDQMELEQQNPQQQQQQQHNPQQDRNNNHVPSPNAVSYSTVMKAWSRCTDDSLDGAQKAANLLQRMRDQGVRPNVICYNTVIYAWAYRGQWEKAEETLWQLLETCSNHENNNNKGNDPTEERNTRMRPTEYSFAPLLHALSKSGRRDAGSKMEEWFDRMEQQWSVTPDRILYNACLYAWAKSGLPHAGVRANALLQQRIHRPDTHSYTSVLDAYSKSTALSNPSLAADQCDALLNQLELLDQDNHNKNKNDDAFILTSQLYNAAMNVFAKSGHAERAEAVMERMKTLSAQGNNNNNNNSNSTRLEPNIVTYATLLDAYTKSQLHDPTWTMERASEMLQFVEDQYDASGGGAKGVVHHLQPNSIFYSAVLQAWAKTGSKEGAERAEALLRRNQALYYSKDGRRRHDYARPNVLIFNAVMDAYARSGEPDVVRKVESLFKEMMEAEQIQPTRRSFMALLLAYRSETNGGAHSSNTEKIEQLLERMRDLSRTTEDRNLLPDTACYNYVLGAICDVASSTQDDTVVAISIAERAQALVNQMEQEEESRWVKPDFTTYSLLVKAWIQVRGDTELSRSTNAHNMTYTALVKLLNQFDDNDDDTQHVDTVTRNDLIRSIIESLKDRSDPAFTKVMKQLTDKMKTQ